MLRTVKLTFSAHIRVEKCGQKSIKAVNIAKLQRVDLKLARASIANRAAPLRKTPKRSGPWATEPSAAFAGVVCASHTAHSAPAADICRRHNTAKCVRAAVHPQAESAAGLRRPQQITEAEMNFTPFGVSVPISAVPVATQFSGKLTQNVTTANGQVVGVLQGSENGVHYIRPLDASSFAPAQQQHQQQTVITLPITMPGAKPGDPQQTVQIQVVNPVTTMSAPVTSSASSPKYQLSQIPIQTFGQGATVLTVAYNSNQEGIQIVDGQNIPDGMTVIAALQPADIQMLQQQGLAQADDSKRDMQTGQISIIKQEDKDDHDVNDGTTVTTMPGGYIQTTTNVQEYLQRVQAQSLTQFLKFNDNIKREQISEDGGVIETVHVVESDAIQTEEYVVQEGDDQPMEQEEIVEEDDKSKKKKKYKKKPPKPKKPKPGQVHIATALDGTTLFCCPECHMAYPEKELLEQHLVTHKIERRFICDICGAGLKRKEHLERHKLGHNPERPFVCSVCAKGFKRKEHLNLHFVIHSGMKTEVCTECGKGFYRKDHLRKHARSHVTRRAKEQQAQLQAQEAIAKQQAVDNAQQQVTIQVKVPTSQTPIQIPVQIQMPQQHLQVTNADGEMSQVSTVVLPTSPDALTVLPE